MDFLHVVFPVILGLAGLLVGWAYFRLMRMSLDCLTGERAQVRRFVGFAAVRVLLFGAGLVGAFLVGAWSLIAYVAGFMVARTVAVRRARAVDGYSARAVEQREA